MINKWITLLLLLFLQVSFFAQENDPPVIEEEISADAVSPTKKLPGQFHLFLDNQLVFGLSLPEGGFGFGETITFQYTLPIHLSFGLEAGYYGFKSEIEEGDGPPVVGGFTILPLYGVVSYNFRIIEGLYITPVVKGGLGFTRARINGWLGDNSVSPMFEGGVRVKFYLKGGFLIQGNVMYTGLIEKSGIFSIMTLGLGFGL
ncbi:MAG: hypothetical protein JEY91_07805 [Spirochaetaceae bacterium]|nr:hypothetical protein [Spirochaetaceae bacterium]